MTLIELIEFTQSQLKRGAWQWCEIPRLLVNQMGVSHTLALQISLALNENGEFRRIT